MSSLVRINGDFGVGVPITLADGTQFIAPAVVITDATGATAGNSVTISPIQTDATSRSGTITAGGTAQQLMAANASRKGWLVQNQSTGDLYVRSRGNGGTTDATADQNSLKIPAGAMYVADYITANALSIIGATTTQAFFAREW